MLRPDEQLDLGAAQHNALGSGGNEVPDYGHECLPGFLLDDPEAQLFVDHPMDGAAPGGIRNEHIRP